VVNLGSIAQLKPTTVPIQVCIWLTDESDILPRLGLKRAQIKLYKTSVSIQNKA